MHRFPRLVVSKKVIVDEIIMRQTSETPDPIIGYIQVFANERDNCLYFKNGEDLDHILGGQVPSFKSYTFRSERRSGIHYVGGFYSSPDDAVSLTEAAPGITYGESGHPYAAHAFAISGGKGVTDGEDLVLTVSGTSITDAGVRIENDSQVIVVDATNSELNEYNETPKKWLGEITYTLTSVDGTAFSYSFNYGYCKYEDWGNRDFRVTDFEVTGNPNRDDSNFDIELLHHKAEGWIYHPTAFIPGSEALFRMTAIHGKESDIDSDEPFAFKVAGQSQFVNGGDSEGTIIRITTGANDSIYYMNLHIGVDR